MLLRSQLRTPLNDCVFGSIKFLNEVIGQFPKAISFAPGAPHPSQFENLDLNRYVSIFERYLRSKPGMNAAKAAEILYQYGPTSGIINDLLANALSKDLKKDVSARSIITTVGAQEGIFIALQALFGSGNTQLIVPRPCYSGVIDAARLLEIETTSIEDSGHGLDIDELERICQVALKNHRPIRALYVAPDYSNPVGSQMSLAHRLRLLKLAEEYDFYILEDSTYAFTSNDRENIPQLKTLDTHRRVIFIGTFSKSCFPGVRIGYVIADQIVHESGSVETLLVDQLVRLKSVLTINTSSICQAILGGLILEHGTSIATLERKRTEFYQGNLSVLLDALKSKLTGNSFVHFSWNRPKGGFFVRLTLPFSADIPLLERSAKEFGVIWTPMSFFYPDQNGGHNQIRLSCSYLSHPQIEEGIDRLAALFLKIQLEMQSPCCKTALKEQKYEN